MTGPKLVVYGCRHSATPVLADEAARTAAGLPDIEYRELPCLGALDPLMAMRDLDSGVDKVLAVGCYQGRCEHLNGSKRAQRAIGHLGDVLEAVGVDRGRVGVVLGSPIDGREMFELISRFLEGQGGDLE